jgi:hypothetical protein
MSTTSRRQLLQDSLGVAGVTLLAGCGVAFARWVQPVRLHRIGFLASGGQTADHLAAFHSSGIAAGKIADNHGRF